MTNQDNQPDGFGTDRSGGLPLSRRQALAGLLVGGGLRLLPSASAEETDTDDSPKKWKRDVDAQGHDLMDLGGLTTTNLHATSRISAVVWRDSDGTVYADGPDGVIDCGPDAGAVLQSIVDGFGEVGAGIYVTAGEYPFDTPVSGIPTGTHVVGESKAHTRLKGGGIGDGYMLESAQNADYICIEECTVSGVDETVSGIHLHNDGSGPGGSLPAHHVVREVNVVNCDVGIFFDAVEDSRIVGGRIGGNHVGVRYEAPGGYGLVTGECHLVGNDVANLQCHVQQMVLDGVLSGNPNERHVQLLGGVQQLGIHSCWFERAASAVDTVAPDGTEHELEQLVMTGASRVITGDSKPVIKGDVTWAYLEGGVFLSSDGTGVDVFERNPGVLAAPFHPRLGANVSWGHKGFRRMIAPLGADGGAVEIGRVLELQWVDLSFVPASDFDAPSVVAIHNGNDGNPEGLYRADPDNDRWIRVADDGETTIGTA